MAKTLERAKPFKPRSSRAQNGIALIFDLEGFSKFFNQPDVHEYMSSYLNTVIRAVEIVLFGGIGFWREDKRKYRELSVLPIHRKFLGDGMLYLWTPQSEIGEFNTSFITTLCNRLWNIKNAIDDINRSCADSVPVFELPSRIRFGVGRGTIYELSTQQSSAKEYLGLCINLASRLQGYCPALGFIASARLAIPQTALDKHGYTRVVATKIKGFPKEIVIVDQGEFSELDDDVREDLFMVI